jgi:XTP/dITP diphosphohydrolase
MNALTFVTGNSIKFKSAQRICGSYDIALQQFSMDIPEIQSHESEAIARDKALRVYEQLKRPIIISDDTWLINGLRGFPGPYMKFVNDSFTADDWLRLTAPLQDRGIILRQIIIFQDGDKQQLFSTDIPGVLLDKIRGKSVYPHNTIMSFDGGRQSIAEMITTQGSALAASKLRTSWHDLCEWFIAQSKDASS